MTDFIACQLALNAFLHFKNYYHQYPAYALEFFSLLSLFNLCVFEVCVCTHTPDESFHNKIQWPQADNLQSVVAEYLHHQNLEMPHSVSVSSGCLAIPGTWACMSGCQSISRHIAQLSSGTIGGYPTLDGALLHSVAGSQQWVIQL